jgi:Contractile injection system tube protein
MERVAFVVESTGERLGCLLNPESLQVTRNAGVRRRRTATGLLAGAGISDDPLLYAGGGQTQFVLDLLFDIGIAGSTIQTKDVRDLTRPLWDLAESTAAPAGATPPVVRFLWGKSWNIPGVITTVAERLEQFTPDGAPTRSWLRMRFVRVNESAATEASTPQAATPSLLPGAGPDTEAVHQVVGGGSDAPGSGERLEDIAFLYYGDPSVWRLIAAANDIVDPSSVAPGTVLRIPPSPEAVGGL